LKALSDAGARIILRMPVIPEINDGEQNLRRVAALAAGLPGVERIDLLPYHPSAAGKYERLDLTYALHQTQTPSEERMQEIASLFARYPLNVRIEG
jgi:pyruvate formate lyase activating enzyme